MRKLLVIPFLFLALFLTSCGDNQEQPAPAEEAPPLQEMAVSAQEAMAEDTSASLSVTLSGSAQAAENAPAELQALSGVPLAASMSGDFSDQAADAQFDLTVGDESVSFRLTGDQEKTFIEYEDAWYETPGALLGSSTTSEKATPEEVSEALTQLEEAGITAEGSVEADEYVYQVMIDAEQLSEFMQKEGTKPSDQRVIDQLVASDAVDISLGFNKETSKFSRLDVGLSLDSEDLAILSEIEGEPAPPIDSVDVNLTSAFTDWGVEVTPEIPSSDELRPEDELNTQLGLDLLGLLGSLGEGQSPAA